MLSRIERCSSEVSCVTTEICARRLSCVTRAMSWPSIRMRPSSRSKKRSSRLTSVDLPAPERPTSPIFSPGFTVSEPSITAEGALAVIAAIVAPVAEAHVLEARSRRA